jgi:LuxR family transcriptional regulator, maltose regulon positive regulatory protein
MAEPEGWVRIFVDEGRPMLKLVREAVARRIRPDYGPKLLAAWGHGVEAGGSTTEDPGTSSMAPPAALVEPLSERELEVLRLLAAGMSNPEIAEHLYIAVSTVRSHCKNIYGKLGVGRRWDAVQRGNELGLI